MQTKTDVKQEDFVFEKWLRLKFWPIGGLKWRENQIHEAHISYISKSSSNDYVNQNWCETAETYCENDENSYFWPIWWPKNGPIVRPWGPYFTHL